MNEYNKMAGYMTPMLKDTKFINCIRKTIWRRNVLFVARKSPLLFLAITVFGLI